jgi:opacity protein-like surface antigen
MRLIAAAGLAGACLASSPLHAADLFGSSPPPMAEPMEQAELGSNWYIRGDVGYGQITQATVETTSALFPTITRQPIGDAANALSPARGNAQTKMNADIGLGFGYRINDWFRAEADWQFSQGPGWSTTRQVYCPEVATAVSNYGYANAADLTGTATPVGYQYSYNICDGNLNVKQYNNTALAMGYIDLGHFGLISPYIGAGGGVNVNTITGTLNYVQTDTGTTYQGATVSGSAPATWVTPSGNVDQAGRPIYIPVPQAANPRGNYQSVGPADWHRSLASNKYTFAVAVAAGVGIKISQSATLDLAYKAMTLDVTGGVKGLRQSVSLGVRYNLN